MRNTRKIVFIMLICIFLARPVHAIFVTDIIAYSKMALEFGKQWDALKIIVDTTKKLNDDFEEFKGKFAKIHSGIKREALDILLNFKELEFYFNSPYVRISKDDPWKEIWEDSNNLFKRLPFLKDRSPLRTSKLYSKNTEYKKRVDYRIAREDDIYEEYENVLNMITDTRKVISKGKEKYRSVESLIRKFSNQRSTGKLIGLLCNLKLEQLVKLDLLITSMRMKMELTLKEQIIRMDLAKKREIEIHEDRKRDEKDLNGVM